MSLGFIPIIICAVFIPVFWYLISQIYKKNYSGDILIIRLAEIYCSQSKAFNFSPNLLNIKFHLITKFIVFLVCAFFTCFTDGLELSSFILFTVTFIHFYTFYKRTKEYKNEISLDPQKQDALAPIYKGYIIVSVYQAILYVANFIVYYLDV